MKWRRSIVPHQWRGLISERRLCFCSKCSCNFPISSHKRWQVWYYGVLWCSLPSCQGSPALMTLLIVACLNAPVLLPCSSVNDEQIPHAVVDVPPPFCRCCAWSRRQWRWSCPLSRTRPSPLRPLRLSSLPTLLWWCCLYPRWLFGGLLNLFAETDSCPGVWMSQDWLPSMASSSETSLETSTLLFYFSFSCVLILILFVLVWGGSRSGSPSSRWRSSLLAWCW